jgi:DNA-binding GntR family transcriptional regulator
VTASKGTRMTKQERVYREIRERILSGIYVPGYRIVIDAVVGEFEMSSIPVREAIRRLEAEGLVVFRPNVGAQVAPADPGQFDQEMTVLAVLEGYATAITAPHLGDDEIKRLTEINDNMIDAMEHLDPLRFGHLNQEFHMLIYDHCPNSALVDRLREVARRLDAIRRTVFVQIPYRGASSVAEHRVLIELLTKRAPPEEIEAAARQHKLGTVESFRAWRHNSDSA